VALGKLAGALPRSREALEVAWRRVEELGASKPARLEAWSFLAASAAASAEMIETAVSGLLEALAEPEPDSLGQVTEVRKGAERLLELSGEASEYVNAMPVIVRALVRVGLAPAAEAPVRRRVLTALVNRWREQVGGRRLWGPAAASGLIEGLRDLAAGGPATAADRLAVVRALGLRLADPLAMRAISQVLAADGTERELAAPAASAALALLALRDAKGRPEILAALARILGRAALETGTPRSARLRERLAAELFEGLRDEVPGVFEALGDLAGAPGLPEPLRQEVRARLAARRALTARPPA